MKLPRIAACAVLLGVAWSSHPHALGAQQIEDYDYENLEFRGVGVDFGMVWPVTIEPTISMGIRADLGFLGPNLRIMPGITYWSSFLRAEEVRRLELQIADVSGVSQVNLGQIRRSDLTLNAEAHYFFDPELFLQPYAGGGLGLHFLNGRGEVISGTFVEDLLTTVAPSLNVVGGLEIPLGSHLAVFTEGRYSLSADVRYGSLYFGGIWHLQGPTAGAPAPGQEGSR